MIEYSLISNANVNLLKYKQIITDAVYEVNPKIKIIVKEGSFFIDDITVYEAIQLGKILCRTSLRDYAKETIRLLQGKEVDDNYNKYNIGCDVDDK